MNVPKMRTVPEAFKELKAADPNTALTMRAFRAAVNRGEIPVVLIGNKRLINLDQFFAILATPSSLPKDEAGEVGKIRPVR
jgi:hypothetical protein